MKVAQLCPNLCHPMDYTVHGILQARILEWVVLPLSRGSCQQRDQIQVSSMQADSLPAEPPEKPKNTGVGSLSLLQWIFATQELNRGLLHCRQILYQLSYQRSPGGLILENLPAKAGDIGSILGLGRCRREGNGNSLQYF